MKMRLTMLVATVICSLQLWAQQITVTGTVYDQTDEPVPGATVLVKSDPKTGTVTDIDGHFTLSVPEGKTLVVRYIGYNNYEKKITTADKNLVIKLTEDAQTLNEVVAIGYGTQKKKLVTGATVQVKGDEIANSSNVSAFTALQSRTPGVQITTNSGLPGDGFKVSIRGVGTTGDASPLYIIDGLIGGDLNAVNPNDIESIDILKDAASTAIYGARAANGVVLVTTRHGREGRPQITFDFYYGWQNMTKKPQILNAKEYMTIMDEASVNDGQGLINWTNYMSQEKYDAYMSGANKGTNWVDEMMGKNAPVQNYTLGVNGGSEYANYALSLGYTGQNSLIMKDYFDSKYERYNARMNSNFIIYKLRDFNLLSVGENFELAYTKRNGLGISQWDPYSNIFRQSTSCYPIMDNYNEDGTDFNPDMLAWSNNRTNPVMQAYYGARNQKSNNYSARGNVYLELQPIKDLKLRTQFGIGYSSWTSRSYSEVYNYGTTFSNPLDIVNQSAGSSLSWSWENTITYNKTFAEKHNLTALVGMSAEKWGYGEGLDGSNKGSQFNDFEHAYLANFGGVMTNATVNGYPMGKGSLVSYFGRVSYDYDARYMATVTVRGDGSSNFARGHRWGVFPSFSVGWNLANEKFMESQSGWLDQFKLRLSWGQNGNNNISNFQYLTMVALGGANYIFGSDAITPVIGSYPNLMANPDITWEKSEQFDVGFDSRFLGGRLGVVFDYYIKTTKDWLVIAPILASYGTDAPYINGGDVRNTGLELGLTWNDHAGDFTYSANVNLGYNKNKVTRLANAEGIINGNTNTLATQTDYVSRVQVGYPIGYFYGYKTAGIFQNEAEVNAYKGAQGLIQPDAKPGDVRFVDVDGDGKITAEDRTQIGNPHPDVNLGINLNFGWKGIDLAISGVGAFGHQIIRSYRDYADRTRDNYTMDIAKNRWHGEGSSNRYPRVTLQPTDQNWNRISDIYVEDADYFRISNITLGYDFKYLWRNCPFSKLRLYFTVQNLCTITGYDGIDPEMGHSLGNWQIGVDNGHVPVNRTFLIGANITF